MGDKKIYCIDCNKDFIFKEGSKNFMKRRDTATQSGARTAGAKERLKKEPVVLDCN